MAKLKALLTNSPDDIRSCPHTKADPDLRMLVDDNLYEALTYDELLSYAILTGADQILFEHGAEASKAFKSIFKGLPIPVVRKGFGCVRVIAPEELIKKSAIPKNQHYRRR